MPCGKPTHRLPPVAKPLQRLDMLELSISGNPNLTIDNTEISSTTPNFTINSLDRIRSRIGSEAPIFLCMGSDTLNHIDSWYKWTELTNYCHIVAISRPGSPKKYSPQLTEWISSRRSIDLRKLKESPAGCVYQCTLSMLNISSTKIRQKIKQNETLQKLLPKKVVNYIQTNHLYK